MFTLLASLLSAAACLQSAQAAVVDGVEVVARAAHPAVTSGQASCDHYSDLVMDKLEENLALFGFSSAVHDNRELSLPAHVCNVMCKNLSPAWCIYVSAGHCTGGGRRMTSIAHSDNITSAVTDECFYQSIILELSIYDAQWAIPSSDNCSQHFDASQWNYDCVYLTDV